MDVSFGNYSIKELFVNNCGDKGLSVGEISTVNIKNFYAKKVNFGLATKDYATSYVDTLIAEDVTNCLSAYSKKQEFGGGFITVEKMNCSNYINLKNNDLGSKILINQK